MEIRKKVDDLIEAELERIIELIQPTEDTIRLIFELVESQYREGNFLAGEGLRPALDVYIPKIIKKIKPGKHTATLNEDEWLNLFQFASTYYHLRDIIFLSFDNIESVDWSEQGDEITAIIQDSTFNQQLAYEQQIFALNSATSPSDSHIDQDKLLKLTEGTERWDQSNPSVQKALTYIESETNWKIQHFFSHIPAECELDLGKYKYCEFYKVYWHLLLFSLYERAYSKANNLSCVIKFSEQEIVGAISQNTNLPKDTCSYILRDIASSSRGTFNYLKDTNSYLLLPFSYSLKDGIAAILKQQASRDSDGFSANFAKIIGDSLVTKVSNTFAQFRNFRVEKEIILQSYDPLLPDIDVLALSYEPSLGFHAFVCEVKNNLPATWAKEYLKTKGKKGSVTKALDQAQKLKQFLKTEDGINLLQNLISKNFSSLDLKKLFPTGYCITIDFLIVTSQSMGMFFPEKTTTIINNDMLHHIASRSDGDTNYILWHLWNMDKAISQSYEETIETKTINNIKINFSSCRISGYFKLDQHSYLSNGTLENYEKESLETGYRYIDTLPTPENFDHSSQKFLITIR